MTAAQYDVNNKLDAASRNRSVNSAIERVECPMVKNGCVIFERTLRRRLLLHLTKNDGSPFENARKESELESGFECALAETILANADGEKTRELFGRRLR